MKVEPVLVSSEYILKRREENEVPGTHQDGHKENHHSVDSSSSECGEHELYNEIDQYQLHGLRRDGN